MLQEATCTRHGAEHVVGKRDVAQYSHVAMQLALSGHLLAPHSLQEETLCSGLKLDMNCDRHAQVLRVMPAASSSI